MTELVPCPNHAAGTQEEDLGLPEHESCELCAGMGMAPAVDVSLRRLRADLAERWRRHGYFAADLAVEIEQWATSAFAWEAEAARSLPGRLASLGDQMLADSAAWFPAVHKRGREAVTTHFALGLGGEAGEVLDVIKKADVCGLTARCAMHADGVHSEEALASELADVLTYLLALAAHLGIDVVAAYESKRRVNVERWGDPGLATPSGEG